MMKNRLTVLAKNLRSHQTDAETILWNQLRNRQINGIKFRRQQRIGTYIVDFVNFEHNVVVELDGGQHNNDNNRKKDEQRTDWLESEGYHVLRFWNNDVIENLDGVINTIIEEIEGYSPSS